LCVAGAVLSESGAGIPKSIASHFFGITASNVTAKVMSAKCMLMLTVGLLFCLPYDPTSIPAQVKVCAAAEVDAQGQMLSGYTYHLGFRLNASSSEAAA
jgi:hypothetical protein